MPRQQRLKRLAVFSFHFLLSRHRRVALGDKIVFAQDLQRLFAQLRPVTIGKRTAGTANAFFNHRTQNAG